MGGGKYLSNQSSIVSRKTILNAVAQHISAHVVTKEIPTSVPGISSCASVFVGSGSYDVKKWPC